MNNEGKRDFNESFAFTKFHGLDSCGTYKRKLAWLIVALYVAEYIEFPLLHQLLSNESRVMYISS